MTASFLRTASDDCILSSDVDAFSDMAVDAVLDLDNLATPRGIAIDPTTEILETTAGGPWGGHYQARQKF